MRIDIGSNYTVDEGLPALSRTAETYYTASIDHKEGACGAFFVSCGVWATSLVATLQHSDDDGDEDTWADEVTGAGNDVSATLLEASDGQINVPNPRERYSRVKLELGGTCVAGITSILGPLRTTNAQ